VEQIRPYLLGVSLVLLGVAFYLAYVRRPSRRNRLIAWGSAALTAVVWLLA
jgi:hypothetical protein